jgi:hypothetical protein
MLLMMASNKDWTPILGAWGTECSSTQLTDSCLLRSGRTSIVIAHRLSTIAQADQIAVDPATGYDELVVREPDP